MSSYYNLPIINQPVWQAPDIPGYLFLGGLAGAGAVVAAGSQLTGRKALTRASKLGAAGAAGLSLLALVHDLGRPERFFNMLRVFKVTSPMSVGSWLLAAFAPAAGVAALSDLTGRLRPLGTAATASAAAIGPAVASYTAALISNTAVPAWHEGHELMPFVFVSSATTAAAGLGLVAAPASESGPLKWLGAGAALTEVGLSKLMEKRMGMVGEAYREPKAERYMKPAEILGISGAVLALLSGRGRARRAAAGMAMLSASALARFGIFEAGIASAKDPRYTVEPQRKRALTAAHQPTARTT